MKENIYFSPIHFSDIQIDDWLYYPAERYFGQVIKKDDQGITLKIVHFRSPDAGYQTYFDKDKAAGLKKKTDAILIDPEIEQAHPSLYQALEKSFIIWKKMDQYIFKARNQGLTRKDIVPELYLKFGAVILAKWAAGGYLAVEDIELLNKVDFCTMVLQWKRLDELANDDATKEKLLAEIDRLRPLDIDKLDLQNLEDVRLWIMAKSGYYKI